MRKTILLAASALSTVAAAGAAHAQAAAPTPVEAVVVTARTLEDTLPEQLSQAGVKVEVIPGQAIRNGGYVDVATALQTLAPGLQILPQSGPFSYVDLSLLGSRTQDVLWLIDGVRINNRLYVTTTPLDTVPAGIVDRIEQVEGGQSLFYGTQAVAGAINIVTKPFSDVLTGALRVGGDTNRSGHIDASIADRFKFGQVVLYGSGDVSEGYRPFPEKDYQPSATDRSRDYAVGTLGAKYAVDLSQAVRLQASYQRTQADLDYAYGPFRINSYVNHRAEDLGTVKLDWQVTDRLALFIKGYGHNWQNHATAKVNIYQMPGTVFTVPSIDNAFYGYWDYGVNALGRYDVTRGVEAYFGYDFQSYGGRDDALAIRQQDENTHAGFGQIRLTPDLIPNTTLTAGVRYNAPSVGQSVTVWTVTGKYELPSGFYLKGEAGTNFRLPTAEELFANDPFAGEFGNPDLKPETSIGGNLTVGMRFALAGHASRVELTGFSRDIENLIALTGPLTGRPTFDNLSGTMRTRGGQVLAETAVTPSLSANVNATYSQSKDSAGAPLEIVPESLYKAGLDWHPADLPVGASVGYVYTGKTTKTVIGKLINYGDYATLDMSGRYFIDGARHHQLNVSVQNLFDRAYGQPYRGCRDALRDRPLDCSQPYAYTALGLPRTVSVSYRYSF